MNKSSNKNPKTVEEKLDLIWERCKRNMSDFSTYETEMIDIRKKVSENNSDPSSPLLGVIYATLKKLTSTSILTTKIKYFVQQLPDLCLEDMFDKKETGVMTDL